MNMGKRVKSWCFIIAAAFLLAAIADLSKALVCETPAVCWSYGVCYNNEWFEGCEYTDSQGVTQAAVPGSLLGDCAVCECSPSYSIPAKQCEWVPKNSLCHPCHLCEMEWLNKGGLDSGLVYDQEDNIPSEPGPGAGGTLPENTGPLARIPAEEINPPYPPNGSNCTAFKWNTPETCQHYDTPSGPEKNYYGRDTYECFRPPEGTAGYETTIYISDCRGEPLPYPTPGGSMFCDQEHEDYACDDDLALCFVTTVLCSHGDSEEPVGAIQDYPSQLCSETVQPGQHLCSTPFNPTFGNQWQNFVCDDACPDWGFIINPNLGLIPYNDSTGKFAYPDTQCIKNPFRLTNDENATYFREFCDSGVLRDRDENQAICEDNTGCVPFAWRTEGEQLESFGGYGDDFGFDFNCLPDLDDCIECCGDDLRENALYLNADEVFTVLLDDPGDNACCNLSTDCVYNSVCYDSFDFSMGTHYLFNNSFVPIYNPGSPSDEICYQGEWHETEWETACNALGYLYDNDVEWDKVDEDNYMQPSSPVPGMCCGDDSSAGEGNSIIAELDSAMNDGVDSDSCCNEAFDCVDESMCFTTYSEGICDYEGDDNDGDTCREIGEGAEDSGIITNDLEICENNQWHDQDEGFNYCNEEQGSSCNGADCWKKEGETNGPSGFAVFGGYNAEQNTECCGDDIGEFFRLCQGDCDEAAPTEACCDAGTDCLADSSCYPGDNDITNYDADSCHDLGGNDGNDPPGTGTGERYCDSAVQWISEGDTDIGPCGCAADEPNAWCTGGECWDVDGSNEGSDDFDSNRANGFCCSDDTGENKIRESYSVLNDGIDSDGCCDVNTDCVDDNSCYSDLDSGNGDYYAELGEYEFAFIDTDDIELCDDSNTWHDRRLFSVAIS